MPSFFSIGPEGAQDALALVSIGYTEPLDIMGGEAPLRDLSQSDLHRVRPVRLLRAIFLVQHFSGHQMQTKQDRVGEIY
jgi:hypothetical protein